jgi:hypothetical protein
MKDAGSNSHAGAIAAKPEEKYGESKPQRSDQAGDWIATSALNYLLGCRPPGSIIGKSDSPGMLSGLSEGSSMRRGVEPVIDCVAGTTTAPTSTPVASNLCKGIREN